MGSIQACLVVDAEDAAHQVKGTFTSSHIAACKGLWVAVDSPNG